MVCDDSLKDECAEFPEAVVVNVIVEQVVGVFVADLNFLKNTCVS